MTVDSQTLGLYFQSFAKHFNLYENIEFGKTVISVEKSSGPTKWLLRLAGEKEPRPVDKIVWATGGFLHPRPVKFEGQEQFTGRILHSQDVRNLAKFKNKNVGMYFAALCRSLRGRAFVDDLHIEFSSVSE